MGRAVIPKDWHPFRPSTPLEIDAMVAILRAIADGTHPHFRRPEDWAELVVGRAWFDELEDQLLRGAPLAHDDQRSRVQDDLDVAHDPAWIDWPAARARGDE